MKGLMLAAVGAACLLRGLRYPVRALVRSGEVKRCPGKNSFDVCDPTLSVVTSGGEPCFSVTRGTVALVGEDYVHILSRSETVILMYQGLLPSVRAGDVVSPGQPVGRSTGTLSFGVTSFTPEGASVIEPSSWLVSRGYRPTLKKSGALWCDVVREVTLPKTSQESCPLTLPEPSGFTLFPVRIQTK